jgi:hypothetical protein
MPTTHYHVKPAPKVRQVMEQVCIDQMNLRHTVRPSLLVGTWPHVHVVLNASSLRKRVTHECCINESVSRSYVGKSVVSLLSILTIVGGEGPTIPTMGVGEVLC